VEKSALVMQESLSIARGINDDWGKSSVLTEISLGLSKLGQVEESALVMQESLSIARGLSDNDFFNSKSLALRGISVHLCELGQVVKALTIARSISDDGNKSSALKEISVELSKQGEWVLAKKIALEINEISPRQSCWEEIAIKAVRVSSWQKALDSLTSLESQEAQPFYIKGWVKAIDLIEVDENCLMQALPLLSNDSVSIESFLQKYAIREFGLGHPSNALTSRLNGTLNLNWLSDITAHFHRSQASSTRSSNNLGEWLHEIQDEDDRDQIELWGRQVTKGKISEEEFGIRLKGLV
jgi:hypothetical protein